MAKTNTNTNTNTNTTLDTVIAATHSGLFHADDVLSAAILRGAFENQVEFIRTRKPQELKKANIRFDVGGVYDLAERTFDHHFKPCPMRRSFNVASKASAIKGGSPLSSAGLIWASYGDSYIRSANPALTGEETEKIWDLVDYRFIAGVDAVDCGFSVLPKDVDLCPPTLSHLISSMNPSWTEEFSPDEKFREAMDIMSLFLDRAIAAAVASLAAKALVAEAEVLEGGRVLHLRQGGPWQEALLSDDKYAAVEFVLFPDKFSGEWRVQAVPEKLGAFGFRKGLPETWRGKAKTELAEVTGVCDAVFCHPAGFIGGADSYEGIRRLARLAIG